ncbi:YceI family protein [Tessaracoccus sp. OS52]|uniref:YceI family protein n=1 Tax=Tessaracoccus sp. OS52 TaxID=2886691 RepID=UPI001D10F440|nr:YceI family protein [Tessaracoccus sp. OS52]MCC2592109.1 YceI family protein [Tessaracoccus sp. OS52]
MTDTLNQLANTPAQLTGSYTLDPSHTQIGFVARHAMITKVRGTFTKFEGSASSQPNLEGAALSLTIQAASVDTRNADRDAHLRGEDFFDVEKYPTITFTSTFISAVDAETVHVEGELTIKDVTRPVAIDFDYEGAAVDPFGNERVGISGELVVNRKDFGLEWNAALETGGVLVSEKVTLFFEVSAIKDVAQASADDAAAIEAPVEEPAVKPARAEAAPAKGGFVGWLKKVFS